MSLMRDIILIMKDISQITTDLVRCQVDHFAVVYKETLTRLLGWLLLVLVAIILAMAGLSWILFSIHLRLAMLMGPVASGILLGSGLILVAVIVFLVAGAKIKD